MRKLTMFLVLSVLMGAVVFAGGQGDAGSAEQAVEQVFKMNISQEPQILDPIHFRDDRATSIIYALHEPLLRASTDTKGWEPGLATGYEVNNDRTVYTFKLRSDAKWQDGSMITADDVVFSFQCAVDPKVASEKSFDYFDILNAEAVVNGEKDLSSLGVRAVDSQTVEFTLKRPVDYFIDLIKSPGFSPVQKSARESLKDLYGTGAEKVVSSGPYFLKEWEHNVKIVLERNENYWDASSVALETVEISLATDGNAIAGLYQTEQLDFMEVSTDFIPQYKDTPAFNSIAIARVSFIEFNPNKAFLSNIKIREALSIAFDRTAYVEKVLANGDLPAYGMIPPGLRGKDNGDFRKQAGDLVSDMANEPGAISRAQKLLAAGLAEEGKSVKDMEDALKMLCVDSPESRKLAQAIQQMWSENLDLKLLLVPMQVKMLIPLLMSGEFDMVVGGGRTGVTEDAAYFIDFIYYENKWDDAYYSEMMEESFVTSGNERIDILMQAEKYVLDKFVFIPQNYQVANYVVRENVEGFRRFPVGVQFDFKYVEMK
jgi:oligopeptide transport system substrate-binding protein